MSSARAMVPASSTPTAGAPASSAALTWLATWTPDQPVPDEVAATLPATIEGIRGALAPVTAKGFAVQVDRLLEWAELFGLVTAPADPAQREQRVAALTRQYSTALGALPADILHHAIVETKREHRYQTLPKPGDIWARAAEAMAERRLTLRRLETAQLLAGKAPAHPAEAPGPREPLSDRGREMLAEALRHCRTAEAETAKPQRARADDVRANTGPASVVWKTGAPPIPPMLRGRVQAEAQEAAE